MIRDCPTCKNSISFSERAQSIASIKCGLCGHVLSEPPAKPPRIKASNLHERFNHWFTLHRYAHGGGDWIEAEADAFIKQWVADIAKNTPGVCNCYAEWLAFNHQFDCSSRESFQHSCVDGHNLVRKKLGQSIFTYEQSAKRWAGPRVLFLAGYYSVEGGTETFHKTLIPRMRERMNIIGFCALYHHPGDPAPLKVPYRTGEKAAIEMVKQADVIVSSSVHTLARILPKDRPPVVSVHHSDLTCEWNNANQVTQLDYFDTMVCVNESVAEKYQDIGKSVVHIPNVVDPARVAYRSTDLRSRYDIPTDSKVVLFLHRMSKEKQPLKAVEIARQLPDDWVMVIAGGGILAEQVRKAVHPKVRYVGSVANPAGWLSIADCFLSLSIYEGYGLSVAEAAAAGVPVISTPTGIAPQIGAHLIYNDAPAEQWVAGIVNAKPVQPNASLCDVERFVDQWENVVRETSTRI